jgi:serine/threonine protein kinase
VLISREGEVKLTDFGLARSRDRQVRSSAGIKGTFAFMSPEQATGLHVDARTDVFAAGVVLYACILGRSPFEGDGPLQTLERVRAAEVPRLSERGFPARLDDVFARALAREPAARFVNASQFREELEALAETTHVRPSAAELIDRVATLAPVQPTSRPAMKPPFAGDDVPVLPAIGEARQAGTQRLLPDKGRLRGARKLSIAIATVLLVGSAVLLWRHRRGPGAPAMTGRAPQATGRSARLTTQRPAESPAASPSHLPKPLPLPAASTSPSRHLVSRPPVRQAFLTISVDPWAYVRIDGAAQGTTPLKNLPISPGQHEVVLENPPLGVTRARLVHLDAGAHQTLIEDLTAMR